MVSPNETTVALPIGISPHISLTRTLTLTPNLTLAATRTLAPTLIPTHKP